MSRGHRTALALLLFAGLLGLTPVRAGAASVEDQRRKADQIAEQLERLGDEATALAEQYEATQARLAELQVEVAESEVRVAELEQRLGVVQAQVGELAMQTFVSGDQAGGLGEMLIDSGAITTAVERDQYTRLALSAGQSTTDELDSTLNDLAKERDLLASRQEQAEQLAEDLVDRQVGRGGEDRRDAAAQAAGRGRARPADRRSGSAPCRGGGSCGTGVTSAGVERWRELVRWRFVVRSAVPVPARRLVRSSGDASSSGGSEDAGRCGGAGTARRCAAFPPRRRAPPARWPRR